MLRFHGLCFGEMLVALRHIQTVEPCFFSWACAVKEKNIRGNGRVRREHARGHSDNGMQIALGQQFLFDIRFRVVRPEQKAVRENHRRPPVFLQAIENHRHEQIRRLTARQIGREMIFHVRFLIAAVGRIHQNHVKSVAVRIVQQVLQQRVVMVYLRNVHVMKKQIRDAQNIGKLFLFDTVNGLP